MESVSVHCYGGTRFPSWLGNSSFSKIISLKLSSCKSCSSLPPLGQLASLKELSINRFDAIETVGPEFCGSFTPMKPPFGSLKILRFERMPKWHEWISDIRGAFPLIEELYIISCPNLTKALPSHLLSLTTLEIKGCHEQLVASVPVVPTIRNLSLTDVSRTMELTELPSGLQKLNVEQFTSPDSPLKLIQQMGNAFTTSLDISILDCQMESLYPHDGSPGDFAPAPYLTRLSLARCKKLKSWPESLHSLFPSLTELTMHHCPEIDCIPGSGFPSKLASLNVYECNKLAGNLGTQWDLQSLPFLTEFGTDMGSFLEKRLLPSTLASLCISNIQNLKSLDYEGLPSGLTSLRIENPENLRTLEIQHLTSLKELIIIYCPKLKSFTERLPSSLSHLKIRHCPMLQKRCEQDEGEDWPKISNITDIDIW